MLKKIVKVLLQKESKDRNEKNNFDNYALFYNIEAENAVLCSIRNNYDNDYYTTLLAVGYFHVQSNRIIYSTIIELHNLIPDLVIDYYSISGALKKKGLLDMYILIFKSA